MSITRKEKLLIYCLGRETTAYKVAEAWEEKKGIDINLSLIHI